MGVDPSCTTGAEVTSGVCFSVLAGQGCGLMLARPCTGKGGGKGMFTGGEGSGSWAFSGEGEFSRAGGMGASDGGEGEASWVAGTSMFVGTT